MSGFRERLRGANPVDADTAATATFRLLEHKISSGEIEDVKAMLPADLRKALWE